MRTLTLAILAIASSAVAQCPPCLAAFDDATLLSTGVGSQNVFYAVRAQTSQIVVLRSALVMTDGTDGSIGLWSHDAVNNRPSAELTSALWATADVAPTWKGANFSQPVILQANTVYWVAFRITQYNALPSVRAANSPNGQLYYYSRSDTVRWQQGGTGFEWKYRLHCCPLAGLASYSTSGTACGQASLVPTITTSLAPVLGRTSNATLLNAKPSSAALYAIGASTSQWGAFSLPLDLGPAGAPGCSIYVSFDVLTGTTTTSNGSAQLQLAIPQDNKLLGLTFFSQWTVLDQQANTLGVSLSGGDRWTVGR